MSTIIYPYRRGLNSTAQLRDQGCKVRYGTSRVRQGIATSWGMRTVPDWAPLVKWINPPQSVSVVSDKLKWAAWCTEMDNAPGHPPSSTLEYTTDQAVAREWTESNKVVCRTVLNGHSGEGIIIARVSDEVVDAPLYSRYFAKQREYRILYGPACGVLYVASKRVPEGTELDNDTRLIRTMSNGFVYQAESTDLPEPVSGAVQAVGLGLEVSHGLKLLAYDVVYNTERNDARVVEANSAWGMNEHTASLTCDAMAQIGERL